MRVCVCVEERQVNRKLIHLILQFPTPAAEMLLKLAWDEALGI